MEKYNKKDITCAGNCKQALTVKAAVARVAVDSVVMISSYIRVPISD